MKKNTTTATTNKTNSKAEVPAVYGFCTEDFIKVIENEKLLPWQKTWSSVGLAKSLSGREYNLLNQLLLGKSGVWGSFKAWSDKGYKVKKGEKSSRVYEWFFVEPKKADDKDDDKADDNKKTFKKGYMKYYPVFHESQVEDANGKPYKAKKSKVKKLEPIKEAEKFVSNYKTISKIKGIKANKESNDAYYNPTKDIIVSPKLSQYKTANDFYSTLFHEIIHSTGHKSRLDRGFEKVAAFGTEDYSKEELVAELGSAILCAKLGIDNAKTVKDSAKYCKGWIKALKGDASLLVSASSYAEKAVKYALGEC